MRRLKWLASNAFCIEDAYKILDEAINVLEPAIAAAKRGALSGQQATQQSEPPTPPAAATGTLNDNLPQAQSSEMLQNPAHVPKKGRPTEREKRKKTLAEQRGDELKKKAKQQEKKTVAKAKPRPGKILFAASTRNKKGTMCRHVDHSKL